jgi:hypothetical protein
MDAFTVSLQIEGVPDLVIASWDVNAFCKDQTLDAIPVIQGDVTFDQGGVMMTEWMSWSGALAGGAGSAVTLVFHVADAGDTAFDTAVLLDRIRFCAEDDLECLAPHISPDPAPEPDPDLIALECLEENCGDPLAACLEDAQCNAVLECVLGCEVADDTCVQACADLGDVNLPAFFLMSCGGTEFCFVPDEGGESGVKDCELLPNTDPCCLDDSDCDDGNECTMNSCNEEGICVAMAPAIQACCPADGQVFSVDFEAEFPFIIENSSKVTGWAISSVQSLSESHSVRFGNKNGGAVTLDISEATLTSDSFIVPPSASLDLHYWTWASQGQTPVVRILTVDGAQDVITNHQVEIEETWEEVVVNLTPWAGQEIAIEFFFYSSDGSIAQVFIDDISVVSDCYFPVCGDGECKGGEDCYLCPEDCEYPAACPENDGCNIWGNPGCAECECQECVCDQDSTCCDVAWDNDCVELCSDCMPSSDCGPQPGCLTSDGPGCGGCECEAEVCVMDHFCCDYSWDSACVSYCGDVLGIQCPVVCDPGYIVNCNSGCTFEIWIADNYCDSALNCEETDFDGGDCTPCYPDCENGKNCGADGCGGSCGTCSDGENCYQDGICAVHCGNGSCEPDLGEECSSSCLEDCGECSVCGDGVCADDEDCYLCPEDCEYPATCPENDGCIIWGNPGCAECECQECVCDQDSTCCDVAWDGECVELCSDCVPNADCGPTLGCTPSNDPGCGGCACEAEVCANDSFCCSSGWDSLCIAACEDILGIQCPLVCSATQLINCAGTGCTYKSWMGDNYCDSSLNCEETDFDGGDCTPCYPDCESGKNCGDDGCGGSCGTCSDGENCYEDGICAIHCGNDSCEPELGEECSSCPGDCGECSVCGDGVCATDEDCYLCSEDCEYPAACPENDGCSIWGNPGCAECECQECVCDQDSTCCDVAWDNDCVELCSDCMPSSDCEPQPGCLTSDGPGCGGCECEAEVCAMDSFCCNNSWDSACVSYCENVLGIECPLICEDNKLANCAGTGCTYKVWLGDNYCDSSLNCAEYNFDEGDCTD